MKRQQQQSDEASKFAERLRQRMDRLSLQANEVAAKLELGPSAVSNWLAGANEAKGRNLRQLAELLGVSPAWLVGDEDEPTPIPSVPYPLSERPELEAEVATWKRRAQEAEQRLADLQTALRSLLGLSSLSSSLAPEAPPGSAPPSLAAKTAAALLGDKKRPKT